MSTEKSEPKFRGKVQFSTILESKDATDFDIWAQKEYVTRGTLIRRVLMRALNEWRKGAESLEDTEDVG